MKRIYAFLVALLLAVSFSLPADAAWNIRQKGNGSAVWVDGNSIEVPVGSTGLVVPISAFATASTYFAVTHKPGRIKKFYVVNNTGFAAQSAAPGIKLGLSGGALGYFTPISAGAELTMTTSLYAGVPSNKSTIDSSPDVTVSQGTVISVGVVQSSSGVGSANAGTTMPVLNTGTVVIIIE